MMARVGSCDASPPPLPSGRAAAYATASSTLPSPGIWTVHGSTLSPSYAVSTVGYDGPAVIALSDTRSMTASRVPHSPAQHAYYEITQDKQRTSCQQIPLLKVRVDKAGFTSEAELKPPLPGGHPHHEPGSPRTAVACSSSSAKLKKKRPLCRFWKLGVPSSASSRSRLVALLVGIATLVLVAVVASLVYTLYTRSKVDVRKEEIRQDPEAGSWAVEVTFRVTNRNYSPDLVDHSSRVFKSLASEVARALDELFYLGPLSQDYNMTQVIEFSASDSSSIGVSCRIVLNQPLTNAAHHVGLAFIQVLEQGHGILPAGNLRVDIRSLHFTNVKPGAVPPPVMVTHGPSYFDAAWSPWSPWSDCTGHDGQCNPNRLRSRRRECRSHYGRGSLLPDNLACLEQGGKEVEFKSCLCPTRAPPPTTTTDAATSEDDDDDEGDSESENATAAPQSTTREKATADTASQPSMPDDWRPCHQCQPGEICFMNGEETKPHCVTPKDPNDPRGCGGWCSGPNELCQRLDNNTVHCIDDSECLHDEWRCKNGLCIPEQRRCDGHFNCYDMTDEYNCECGSDGFHCSNNTSCLPLDRRCNGFVDCWDGSDEANCTALCPASQHTCNSGQCIPMDNFCDSYRDCDDGSDEPPGCDSPCLAHQRQCQNGRCVPGTVWCDGFDSCGDGSDEANCGSAAPSRDRSSVVPALPPGHLLGRLLSNKHRKAVHPQTPVARSRR
ncbi:uncharacterized protein LOC119169689 isoform X2 [Rhipicephalus microplus]|uniref:uncharacterized protein LOC119169689 isoform X2 n=1 Tax=Rhipicephalus microplus TaxID=6941 RepID=UPI003F6C3471